MDIDKLLSDIDAEIQRILDEASSREDRSLTAEELQQIEALERRFDVLKATQAAAGKVNIPSAVLGAIQPHGWQPETRDTILLDYEQRMAGQASGLSLGKTLKGLVTGDWRGAEAEFRALGVGAGGAALVAEELAREVIDLARAKTVALQAGAKTLPMSTSEMTVPVLQADPEAAWRDEHAQITQDEPSFTSAQLKAKSLAVLSILSRELIEDSPLSEQAVLRSITAAMAGALDKAILAGAGVGPEPLGILNTSGIHSIEAAGAAITWDGLIDAAAAVAGANRQANAILMHPATRAALAKSVDDTTNDWQGVPEYLRSMTFFDTTALPQDTAIVADMTGVIVGIREMLSVKALVERYADYGQVGIVAHCRADVVVTDPKAIAAVTIPAA